MNSLLKFLTISIVFVMVLIISTGLIPKHNQSRLLQFDPKTVDYKQEEGAELRATDDSSSFLCPRREEIVRIACLGDSITFGDGKHVGATARRRLERGNYPMMLQEFLGRDHFTVQNFGRGGASACNCTDVPYVLTEEYQTAIREFRPHVAIIMLGTNDAKRKYFNSPSYCGPGPTGFVSGYHQLLQGLAYHSQNVAPTVLIIPPPVLLVKKEHPLYNIEDLTTIREALRSTVVPKIGSTEGKGYCGKQGTDGLKHQKLQHIEVSPELPIPAEEEFFTFDEVHLNEKGTRMLACAVLDHLLSSCQKGWIHCFHKDDAMQQHWEGSKQSCGY